MKFVNGKDVNVEISIGSLMSKWSLLYNNLKIQENKMVCYLDFCKSETIEVQNGREQLLSSILLL